MARIPPHWPWRCSSKAGSFDLGPKGSRIEEPAEWSDAKILDKAKLILSDKGPAGKFDD